MKKSIDWKKHEFTITLILIAAIFACLFIAILTAMFSEAQEAAPWSVFGFIGLGFVTLGYKGVMVLVKK